MSKHQEKVQEVVESLMTLPDSDLEFIARIVQVLGAQEKDELTEFDRWTMELAKRNKFDNLSEQQVAELVQAYRRTT